MGDGASRQGAYQSQDDGAQQQQSGEQVLLCHIRAAGEGQGEQARLAPVQLIIADGAAGQHRGHHPQEGEGEAVLVQDGEPHRQQQEQGHQPLLAAQQTKILDQ